MIHQINFSITYLINPWINEKKEIILLIARSVLIITTTLIPARKILSPSIFELSCMS